MSINSTRNRHETDTIKGKMSGETDISDTSNARE
jgi:hypothetical protein